MDACRPGRARPLADRRLRESWKYTLAKCEKLNHPGYARNGGEGARVAEEWNEFEPFYQWAVGAGYRAGM